MQSTEHKTFQTPDETREFPRGRAEILRIGDGEVGRLVFEPGWRWSNDVKPIAQTESCQAPHFQYHVSGRLAIRMDDGSEFIAGPGDITSLPSGHDAWVVGDEPVTSSIGSAPAATRSRPDIHIGPGGSTMTRKIADCRRFESDNNCSLTIIGEEDEVIATAAQHAAAAHGHQDTPELRDQLRGLLEPEESYVPGTRQAEAFPS